VPLFFNVALAFMPAHPAQGSKPELSSRPESRVFYGSERRDRG